MSNVIAAVVFIWFRAVRCMMYGFGDDQNPYSESVDLLEDLVIDYISEMVHWSANECTSYNIVDISLVFSMRISVSKYMHPAGSDWESMIVYTVTGIKFLQLLCLICCPLQILISTLFLWCFSLEWQWTLDDKAEFQLKILSFSSAKIRRNILELKNC